MPRNVPEIKRVDAVVRVQVRAVRIEVGEPVKGRDRIAGMKRLGDQERKESCRADPDSRRGDARAPVPGIDEGEGNHQRQQHSGLRLDKQGIRERDPSADDPARCACAQHTARALAPLVRRLRLEVAAA